MNDETPPAGIATGEWTARVQLAAACRIAARHDWIEGIANHFSLVVPGRTDRFLINPRGMYFSEITASSLVVVDLDGNKLEGAGQVRPVAFRLHGAFHRGHPRGACVLHCHPFYGTTLAMVKGARLGYANYTNSRFLHRVAYDDAPDGTVSDDECRRCVELLGDGNFVFHGGHGLSVVDGSVADALDALYFLERQCKQQVLAAGYAAATGLELHRLPDDGQRHDYSDGLEPSNQESHFRAMLRLLDRDEPDYKT